MATTTKLTKDEITATAELLGGNVAEMPQDRLYHLIKATQHATDLLLNEIKHRGELKSQAMCRLPPRIRLRLYPIKVTQHTTDLLLNEIERLRPNDPAGARVRRMIGTTARPKPRASWDGRKPSASANLAGDDVSTDLRFAMVNRSGFAGGR